ncbi:MAG: DUF1501 domain-containing protein [Lautropia sp.]
MTIAPLPPASSAAAPEASRARTPAPAPTIAAVRGRVRRSRRALLGHAGALAAGALTGAVRMPLAFANAPGENRFVLIVLRGGLDSLHALVPYGDDAYYRLRPAIAVPRPGKADGAIALDDRFGLHPSMRALAARWHERELLIVPAATTGYRNRSHFDAQNQLENGSTRPFGAPDGWLNRAIGALDDGTRGGPRSSPRPGLALGVTTPLVLYGSAPVRGWAPSRLPAIDDDFLARLEASYAGDALLHEALREAIAARPGLKALADDRTDPATRVDPFEELATMAGRMLATSDGPRVAAIESDGWDTHTDQPRRLARRLETLDRALDALRTALGASWRRTVVVVVSEFGRTAAENGNRGTDHGVASLALVVGGAVRGGRLLGEWPGLAAAQLHEGRDLMPTTHYTGVFKGVLREHLGIADAALDTRVFPGQHAVRALGGLAG